MKLEDMMGRVHFFISDMDGDYQGGPPCRVFSVAKMPQRGDGVIEVQTADEQDGEFLVSDVWAITVARDLAAMFGYALVKKED